jgi:hypothetical protein
MKRKKKEEDKEKAEKERNEKREKKEREKREKIEVRLKKRKEKEENKHKGGVSRKGKKEICVNDAGTEKDEVLEVVKSSIRVHRQKEGKEGPKSCYTEDVFGAKKEKRKREHQGKEQEE